MDKPREYLKEMRAKKGLTMQDVADAFGISRQYYNLIETGVSQKRMDITLVRRIADLFGVSLDFIEEREREWRDEDDAGPGDAGREATA